MLVILFKEGMFRRRWTPATYEPAATESKITIYDFGAHCGEMINGEWSCWEIHSRTRNELGEIVEELKEMPQDWLPFQPFTQQLYSGEILQGGFRVRGWSVQTEPLFEQSPSQLNHKSSHLLQLQEHQKGECIPSNRHEIDRSTKTVLLKQRDAPNLSRLSRGPVVLSKSKSPEMQTSNKTSNTIENKQNKYLSVKNSKNTWTPLIEIVKITN